MAPKDFCGKECDKCKAICIKEHRAAREPVLMNHKCPNKHTWTSLVQPEHGSKQ